MPWFSVVCCAVTRLCGVVVLCLCAVLCNTAVALWPQSAKFGKILNLGKWHGCLFPDGVGRAAACCVAAGCLLRRLLVAEVARCSGLLVSADVQSTAVVADNTLQQICNSLFQQICNLLPPACRGGSSPYGSKNHRTTLYCRQADSAAAR